MTLCTPSVTYLPILTLGLNVEFSRLFHQPDPTISCDTPNDFAVMTCVDYLYLLVVLMYYTAHQQVAANSPK